MRTITVREAREMKAQDIRNLNANRYYAGNSATDQRIEYIENMSDEDYVAMYNEVARKENLKKAKKPNNRKINKTEKSVPAFTEGCKVNHPRFGEGTVVSQDENNITVNFEVGDKVLVKKFANLELL